MRSLIIKLSDEEFKRLEEEARNNGFVLLSEYVKYRLFGNSFTSSPRSQDTKTIEDVVNPLTVELLNVKKKLGELAERVETIETTISTKPGTQPQEMKRDRRDERKEEKRPPQQQERRSAIDYLKEQGVMYESKLSNLKNPDAFFDRLESQGAKIIWTAEERIAVDPTFFQNFLNKLTQIHTPDETEAQKYLSKQEHELFQKLRKTGSIYFDNQDKFWKLTS
ncbi:hypothetical protein [Metallosphaera javensis (ex Sakai et al. 2022)]|uniref:hypothetical protein n=1 Tax=Metallosphaera javensis (ex Sakai et al. 2022) TaxID=2775498 RepID=UPI002588B0A0|nr:MAG: hypothetical protein MjAS7_0735 [Metallosphaera javensis (ex Sakai et al. 2022)]